MSSLLIPLAFEWIALITLFAPLVLAGKFRNRPNLGLVIWFASFLSAGVAGVILIAALIDSVIATWLKLHANPNGTEVWWQALLSGFAPWLFLAVAGISLALLNLRLASLIESKREISPLAQLASRPIQEFNGHQVRVIDVPIDHAFTDGRAIYVSDQLWQKSEQDERQRILRHEAEHIRLRHPLLKRMVQVIYLLTPKFAASNFLQTEVNELTEIIARRAEALN